MDFLIWVTATVAWCLVGAPAFAWYKVGICRDDLTTSGMDLFGLIMAAVMGPLSWLVTASFLPGGNSQPKIILRAKRRKHPQQQS